MNQSFCQPTTSPFVADIWRERLSFDCSEQSATTRESIIRWLLGDDLKRFEMLNPMRVEIAQQEMEYRYRILRQRYLGIEPERAYRHLTNRLFSLILLQNQIRDWVVLNRKRQRVVVDVLLEALQELLRSDRYLQQQMVWIAQCSADVKLRNALLFTSTEEYCLRPICNQPLLLYWFVNYLRRNQGGSIQVHSGDWLRLISEELFTQDSESPLSPLNTKIVIQ